MKKQTTKYFKVYDSLEEVSKEHTQFGNYFLWVLQLLNQTIEVGYNLSKALQTHIESAKESFLHLLAQKLKYYFFWPYLHTNEKMKTKYISDENHKNQF